jgi:hypothetical protein
MARGHTRRYVPRRGTPSTAKTALSQGDAAAHPAELRCPRGDIAAGYAHRVDALLGRRDARIKRHNIYVLDH